MYKLPDKLIVVGMRFISKAHQTIEKMKLGADVSLHSDKSEDGVDGWCWKVKHQGDLIGYIRNQDIPLLPPAEDVSQIYGYEVKVSRQNYLVLERDQIIARLESRKPSTDAPVSSTFNGSLQGQIFTAKIDPSQLIDTSRLITNKAKEPGMNTQSLKNQIFREVKNVVLDIQTGALGFQNTEGIATYRDGTVSVNPLVDFAIKVPAFAMRVAVKDLVAGDIIIQGDQASFFHQHTEQGYEVVGLSGEIKQVGNVTNMFFGANTVLAVKNMFGSGGMNPMMMAMMMGEEKEGFDMKTFALMSMMGNQTGDQGNMQQMMLMAMLMNK